MKIVNGTLSVKKAVCIAQPHTSNWDGFFMLCWSVAEGIPLKWIGKKSLFKGPLKSLLLSLGGIPVDRSKSQNLVQQVADIFKNSDELYLGIAPEGSRHKKERWRSGFYHMAVAAEVPIAMGFIDYKTKTMGFGSNLLRPSGDLEKDMEIIRDFYKDKVGKYPEKMGPIRV